MKNKWKIQFEMDDALVELLYFLLLLYVSQCCFFCFSIWLQWNEIPTRCHYVNPIGQDEKVTTPIKVIFKWFSLLSSLSHSYQMHAEQTIQYTHTHTQAQIPLRFASIVEIGEILDCIRVTIHHYFFFIPLILLSLIVHYASVRMCVRFFLLLLLFLSTYL